MFLVYSNVALIGHFILFVCYNWFMPIKMYSDWFIHYILRQQAGALANPLDLRQYNPFDGELTFVGEVLASLPLSIELGKVSLQANISFKPQPQDTAINFSGQFFYFILFQDDDIEPNFLGFLCSLCFNNCYLCVCH